MPGACLAKIESIFLSNPARCVMIPFAIATCCSGLKRGRAQTAGWKPSIASFIKRLSVEIFDAINNFFASSSAHSRMLKTITLLKLSISWCSVAIGLAVANGFLRPPLLFFFLEIHLRVRLSQVFRVSTTALACMPCTALVELNPRMSNAVKSSSHVIPPAFPAGTFVLEELLTSCIELCCHLKDFKN